MLKQSFREGARRPGPRKHRHLVAPWSPALWEGPEEGAYRARLAGGAGLGLAISNCHQWETQPRAASRKQEE